MSKNAITWIREDFRIESNPALSYATQNHERVLALYIYNKNDFDNKSLLFERYPKILNKKVCYSKDTP